MKDVLKSAFSKDNLLLAWKWTLTNSDALYKNYFRHIYRAYSLSTETNLNDLSYRLMNNLYLPTHSTKLFFPKKSGILRPYTLISVEDQIVYQAIINIIAERLFPRVRNSYYKSNFGHLYAGRFSRYFYQNWKKGYRKFSEALRSKYNEGYVYAASFDLTACYDSIDHAVLKHFLKDLKVENEFCDYLCKLLQYWTASSPHEPIYQGHGIPQGPQPSGLLSECILRYFDKKNMTSYKVNYLRYVDDIRLLAKTENELRKNLISLDMQSKNIGLFPQSSKIDIHKISNIDDEIKSISHPPEIILGKPDSDQKKVHSV